MYEKGKPKSRKTESALKRNKFYVALYGCVGIMLVLAVVIGYNNFSQGSKNNQLAKQTQEPQVAQVGKDTVESYLEQFEAKPNVADQLPTKDSEVGEIGKGISTETVVEQKPNLNIVTPEVKVPATVVPAETTKNPAAVVPTETTKNPASEVKNPEASTVNQPGTSATQTEANAPQNNASDSQTDTANSQSNDTTDSQTDTADSQTDDTAESQTDTADYQNEIPFFETFEDTDKMNWPVLGEVVMEYSVDHVIYDVTLDQYRVNDTLCIAADQGTEVRAAADGLVVKVENTRKNGETIVVDHGNGWFTTYSQLQDHVLVNVGDVVTKGQIIGGVGSPSNYSVLLGSHLGFAISRNDAPVNPRDILIAQ